MGFKYVIQILPEPIEVEAETESHAIYFALKELENKIKSNLPRRTTYQVLNTEIIEEEDIDQMELLFG